MSKVKRNYYQTLEEFKQGLKDYRCFYPFQIRDILIHEQAHFAKAKSLGYAPRYCLVEIRGLFGEVRIFPYVAVENVNEEDKEKILRAPKRLSLGDRLDLTKIKLRKLFSS